MSDYLSWPLRWRFLYYGQCMVTGYSVLTLYVRYRHR